MLNAKKTEVMTYNMPQDHPLLITTVGSVLKEVSDFKYLDAWVGSTEKDLNVRKGKHSLESTQWHDQCVEIQPPSTHQDHFLLCHSGVRSPIPGVGNL